MNSAHDAREAEKEITCPYNAAHRILSSRMYTHLVKCRKDYSDTKLAVCPLNVTHRVPEPEMKYHIESCENSANLYGYFYVMKDSKDDTNGEEKYPIVNYNIKGEDEFWDEENHPSYNPEEHIVNKPILRNIKVQPAAVKKNFREEERRRHQILKPTTIKFKDEKREEVVEESVRRPKTSSASVSKNAKKIEEEDPPHVTQLMEALKVGKQSGPILPGVSKNQQPRISAKEPLNLQQESDFKKENKGDCAMLTESERGPWTVADLVKRASKPHSMGRGRSIKK